MSIVLIGSLIYYLMHLTGKIIYTKRIHNAISNPILQVWNLKLRIIK